MNTRLLLVGVVSVAMIVGLVWALKQNSGQGRSDNQDEVVELEFYCAMGLNKPIRKVIEAYEKESGVRMTYKFDGSGALLSSIAAAGRADLYLAADTTYMETARERGIDVREQFTIGYQRPVIAVYNGNPMGIKTLDDLARKDVRLYLADPQVAAISKVARKRMGDETWNKLWAAKLAQRPTVVAVANDVAGEKTGAGIIWDATAGQYPGIEMIEVPRFEQSKNQITLAVLGSSRNPTAALHFARFLTAADRGLDTLKQFGYDVVPNGDEWSDGKPVLQFFAGGLNEDAVKETIREFERREGIPRMTTRFAGCGTLVGLMNPGGLGERPDIYFACDSSYMSKVGSLFYESADVSVVDMVIAVPVGSTSVNTLDDLTKEGLKIGLCHPQKSALGVLSRNLLRKHKILEQVQRNLLDAPATAPELVSKIAADGLDAAIVYRANATAAKKQGLIRIITIDDPAALARQPIAVSLSSKHYHLAHRLVDAILSAKSRNKFQALGFRWNGPNNEN